MKDRAAAISLHSMLKLSHSTTYPQLKRRAPGSFSPADQSFSKCKFLNCYLEPLASLPQWAYYSASGLPAAAQQGLTWEEIKVKFEAANPTLRADALNVDEMKAEEITAFLRPNPQFSVTADGTQIAPNKESGPRSPAHLSCLRLVICMSATTSGSFVFRVPRWVRRFRVHSTRTSSAI